MKTSAAAKTVAAAFWVAGAAFLIAAGLEVAFRQDLQAFDINVLCSTGHDNLLGWLLLGSPATLVVGGIVSLLLALNRRSKGSPARRWAASSAVLVMVLGLVLLSYNYPALVQVSLVCAI
ncbi:MAG TPA: hypothetical protein VGU71_08970 [Candidatus Dormibacteraeota bacterium]|nr:hypothetical protein [Candidatus Dormibacteraeota bacterium]